MNLVLMRQGIGGYEMTKNEIHAKLLEAGFIYDMKLWFTKKAF